MISVNNEPTEDAKMKAIDYNNVSDSDQIEQQVDKTNVKDSSMITESEAKSSKQALTRDIDMSGSTKDESLVSSTTTKHIQVSPNNIDTEPTPDSKSEPSKEMVLSITQAELTALHDKISAQKESIANLNLSLTTSRAKITSQEATIKALRLPLPDKPNEEMAKLKTENTRLNDENIALDAQIRAAETKKRQIINGAKTYHLKLENEVFRRDNELTRRHAIIGAVNKTLITRDAQVRGLQKQLDSVYSTLQRQSSHIAAQSRQHVRKLARINLFFKDGVKSARKRALLQSKRDQADLVELMNFSYASEEEEEESEGEEDGGAVEQEAVEEKEAVKKETAEVGGEIEIVDLVEGDDDDQVVAGGEKTVVRGEKEEEEAVVEQTVVPEQAVVREQSILRDGSAIDEPLVHEKPAIGEPTPPKKRVRLSMEGA